MRLNHIVLIFLLVLMPSTQCQQTAEDWFNKGSSLFDQGESDKAIEAYNEAIKSNPQYAEAWYEKGGILFSQEKYDDAAEWSEPLRMDNELSNINSWREVDEKDEATLRPSIQDISSS